MPTEVPAVTGSRQNINAGTGQTQEEFNLLLCSDEVGLLQDRAISGSESDMDPLANDDFWTPLDVASIPEKAIRDNIPVNVERLMYIDGQQLPQNAY